MTAGCGIPRCTREIRNEYPHMFETNVLFQGPSCLVSKRSTSWMQSTLHIILKRYGPCVTVTHLANSAPWVKFPAAAELQNIHNEPHRRVCKEELHHTFHGGIIPAVKQVKTNKNKQERGQSQPSDPPIHIKEKTSQRLRAPKKKQKKWCWSLTPNAKWNTLLETNILGCPPSQ